MARTDAGIWTFTGIIIGMISSALVNSGNPFLTVLGALTGGIIGYMLGNAVR
ncbi:MAG: hypothetical protein RL557_1071 [archaeon]|jgi:outer membrane lipoprotein SlyB